MSEQHYLEQVLAMQGQLYAVARSILRTDSDAADVMQEAMLAGWKHRRSLKDAARFRPWLMRILVNKCRDLQRRRMRDRKLMEAVQQEQRAPSRDSDVCELVALLPEKLRLPVLFYYFDGYSQKEVAEILAITPEQAKTRVRQGREHLRKWMTEGGDGHE